MLRDQGLIDLERWSSEEAGELPVPTSVQGLISSRLDQLTTPEKQLAHHASVIGAISGILIVPITTLYYDTGFLIGLKGFIAAIIGGLVSYPATTVGAILVGLLESYAAFWSSAFKEVLVFGALIPVLIWQSLRAGGVEEEIEEEDHEGDA